MTSALFCSINSNSRNDPYVEQKSVVTVIISITNVIIWMGGGVVCSMGIDTLTAIISIVNVIVRKGP